MYDLEMYIPLKENDRLSVSLYVGGGIYRVYVRKETVEYHELEDGTKYQSVLTIPFADGNFSFVVIRGRKSAKKVKLVKDYLEEQKDVILDMWNVGRYQDIVNMVVNDIQIELLGVNSQDFKQL